MQKHHRFSFLLRASDKVALEQLAEEEGEISQAAVIRRLICEAFKKREITNSAEQYDPSAASTGKEVPSTNIPK